MAMTFEVESHQSAKDFDLLGQTCEALSRMPGPMDAKEENTFVPGPKSRSALMLFDLIHRLRRRAHRSTDPR